jgi:hypothetical protein
MLAGVVDDLVDRRPQAPSATSSTH